MANGPIVYLENRAEVTGFTFDGSSNLIDVRSFIPSPGNTEATGIIATVINQSNTVALVKTYGGNVSGGSQASVDINAVRNLQQTSGINDGGIYQVILPLSASGEVYYNFPATHSSDIKFYIEAWLSDDWVYDEDYTNLTGGATGSFGDQDLGASGDDVIEVADRGDVVAAIIKVHGSSNSTGSGKVRPKGSVFNPAIFAVRCSYFIVGVDSNDIYEQFDSGKITVTWEFVGYITSGKGLTMFVDSKTVVVITPGSFQTIDLTSDTSADARVALLGYSVTDSLVLNYARVLGSTNPITYAKWSSLNFHLAVGMDEDQKLEIYRESTATIKLLGYIDYSAAPPEPPIRVTQLAAEVVSEGKGSRVTQLAAEILTHETPDPLPLFFDAIPEPDITEEWEWETDILVSWDGTEQRISVKGSPDRKLSFSMFVHNHESRRDRYSNYFKGTGQSIQMPYWQYQTQITALSSEGDQKIFFNPDETDIRADEHVVIISRDQQQKYLILLTTMASDGANTKVPLTNDIEVGWLICPAFPSYYSSTPSISWNQAAGNTRISSRTLIPRRAFVRPSSNPSYETLSGFTILNQHPLSKNSPEEQFNRSYEVIEAGVKEIRTSWERSYISGDRIWRINRYESGAMDYWRNLLFDISGMQNKFLVPTWLEDLIPSSQVSDNWVDFLITDERYDNDYYLHESYTRVQIDTDGGIYYREVTSVVDNLNGTWTVTLGSAIPTGVPNTVVNTISFLLVCRLGSDIVKLKHEMIRTYLTLSIRSVDS